MRLDSALCFTWSALSGKPLNPKLPTTPIPRTLLGILPSLKENKHMSTGILRCCPLISYLLLMLRGFFEDLDNAVLQKGVATTHGLFLKLWAPFGYRLYYACKFLCFKRTVIFLLMHAWHWQETVASMFFFH